MICTVVITNKDIIISIVRFSSLILLLPDTFIEFQQKYYKKHLVSPGIKSLKD